MQLIIVQGETCTGKTTLAKRLAKDISVPSFLKDDYKEQLFETLPSAPNLWQWLRFEHASWQAIYAAVETAIQQDANLLIEGNFMIPQKRALQKLVPTNTRVIELYCYARGDIIVQRYKTRYQSGNRHAGHRDNLWVPLVRAEVTAAKLGWHWVPQLHLSDSVLRIDTSDFAALDYPTIKQFVQDRLRN